EPLRALSIAAVDPGGDTRFAGEGREIAVALVVAHAQVGAQLTHRGRRADQVEHHAALVETDVGREARVGRIAHLIGALLLLTGSVLAIADWIAGLRRSAPVADLRSVAAPRAG